MKFFIDTANIDEIKKASDWGLVDGVTTNPSLVAKEGKDFKKILREICEIVDGPISAEALCPNWKGMVTEGEELSKIHKNIVIKIPMTTDGLKATKILTGKGIGVNVTLIFSPMQALLAAKAGATFVSPFVGRIDDVSQIGMEIVEQMSTIYNNYGYETQIIVASVRHPLHVLDAALIGADIATIPFKVMEQLARHPLTDAGIAKFLKDWEKVPK